VKGYGIKHLFVNKRALVNYIIDRFFGSNGFQPERTFLEGKVEFQS
jgi:hypothetical protein